MSSNIEIKKKCRWCGAEFIARKTTTEYCSHRCSGLAYKERKRQEKLDSYQREYEYQQSGQKEVAKQEFLTPTQAATLLGVCHVTIYNYINRGVIKVWKLKRKTLIRRADVDSLFSVLDIQSTQVKNPSAPITDFYTSKEIQEKYGVSNSGMYKIAEREGWPKTQSRGKTLWSRSHVDRYFANQQPKEEINEWYTAADIQAAYGMTLSAIYTLVSKEGIPKKKQGNYVMYSKYHFDLAKGATVPKAPEYYTYPEAMEKYGLTRDQLHHYLKYHNITRVKKGKYTLILCSELDSLLGSPEI
ncbi:DNA-binding protein [Duncaniella sp. C9]|jgi:excisionase family DNA binding protein|uniref:helix-turn-helix domain-containing protein n=3 Tax=Duncaniella TaxID=2518495 RepID=UPI0010A2E719|nr:MULTISPECIES: helix-turn-helix domain-containing protein [unclassified Duncaniella]QCD40143.1 DNA-binding protein [Duncaniella sp. C9]QCP71201.1 helix-turn-helix domain-containing protein [Duncaniella sp. B8]